jgi:hypothetical protein
MNEQKVVTYYRAVFLRDVVVQGNGTILFEKGKVFEDGMSRERLKNLLQQNPVHFNSETIKVDLNPKTDLEYYEVTAVTNFNFRKIKV